jgi:hypothetical protein
VSSYARHAQRFGVDCVYETAVREWLPRVPGPVDLTWCSPAERERVFREREAAAAERDVALAELMLLRLELDAIEAVRKNGRYTVGKRRRRSPEETRFLFVVLRGQGLVDRAIATRLGISYERVRKLGRDQPKPTSQTRMVEREKSVRT